MNTKNISWIIALIIALGWLTQNLFFIKKCPDKPIIQTIVVKGDSIPVLFKIYKPWPIYVKEIVEVPVIVDSAEVVKAYFSKVFYADTITNDTSILAIIKDTLTQNKILSREVWLQNLRPQQVNNISDCPPIEKNKARVLLGIGIQGIKQFGVPFSVILETPQRMAFSVGFDPINRNAEIGYFYRIK
jgi:hypothetical protein